MKKRLLASVFSVTIFITPLFVSAQSSDLSAALARMDAIIAEMNTLRTEFAQLMTAVGDAAPNPTVAGATSGSILGDDLAYGSTNEDIARVQRLLATDPTIYAYGADTGFFGPKTQAAVRLFQSRFGLDTVGVIGPSTRALLETFFAAYPNENYPANVLQKAVPNVSLPDTTTSNETAAASSGGVLRSLSVTEDDDEYIVRSYQVDGTRNRDLILYPDDFDELIELIATKLGAREAEVRSFVSETTVAEDDDDDEAYNEENAEDAIDEADAVLDDVRDEIREADEDGKDVDEADDHYDDGRDEYRKAQDAFDDDDYENAMKNAEDAIEHAEDALDALEEAESDSDEIDTIEVAVEEDEAEVSVEYENGDDEDFTVDDDDREDIIEEVAKELDLDEDEVADLIEFDYGDIASILVRSYDDGVRVRVEFESGVREQLVLDEDDEDDIIEEIADALDLDEDDVERVVDFDLD